MLTGPWLIYGANGYTGELAARLAKARGHRPILAGRSAGEVCALADALSLERRLFALDDPGRVDEALAGMSLVLHCAGPFSHTSQPMAEACLRAGLHYLDITGEGPVFGALARAGPPSGRAGSCSCPAPASTWCPPTASPSTSPRRLPGARTLVLAFQTRGGGLARHRPHRDRGPRRAGPRPPQRGPHEGAAGVAHARGRLQRGSAPRDHGAPRRRDDRVALDRHPGHRAPLRGARRCVSSRARAAPRAALRVGARAPGAPRAGLLAPAPRGRPTRSASEGARSCSARVDQGAEGAAASRLRDGRRLHVHGARRARDRRACPRRTGPGRVPDAREGVRSGSRARSRGRRSATDEPATA